MDDEQNLKQFANGMLLLVAIANSRVLDAATCERKEIIVMSDDYAVLSESVSDVIFVGGPKQAHLHRGGHVHAVASEANGDGGPNTLVKMISNHHWRPCQVWA